MLVKYNYKNYDGMVDNDNIGLCHKVENGDIYWCYYWSDNKWKHNGRTRGTRISKGTNGFEIIAPWELSGWGHEDCSS